jgi:hypothetical protein
MGALQLLTALLRHLLQSHTRRREPRSPPSDRHPPALGEAPEAPSAGPDLLGLAFPPVARLAVQPDRRPARDRPPLASRRLPPVLALEVTEALRPTQARRGDPCPHPSHVPRQSHLCEVRGYVERGSRWRRHALRRGGSRQRRRQATSHKFPRLTSPRATG